MGVDGFAVDLGGTKIAAARIENGTVAARLQAATDPGADIAAQIDRIAGMLEQLGFRHGDPLGVAVAGRVDATGRWHAVNRNTLRAISAAPLGEMLCARFGARSRALNDAAAAALAEARLGAGRGARNFAFLTISTGVGGGLVLDGRLVESRNGLAGHVGFASSRLAGDPCGSGRIGTVESVASGKAIAAAAGLPDGRAVFDGGRHPELIDRSAAAVAALIADLTAILGLDRVAIGGSIGLAAGYLPQVLAHLSREPDLFRPQVVRAGLTHDSGLIGGLLAALDPAPPPSA
ncbi:ROK family protein [Paracoccus sp. MKU1]|uniref:ROK family protein n=1 Tax=Paracoccus sp. MKU1 TaxID=1745182 RepID=UPI00071941EA|nr:ROK family protein [Paracoccus sp. MKU1]KRW96755.1 N-acetylmannosamine kinase [Paracoccus sp. MKU1]